MATIAVLNQKGGVGKTTICVHLARAFQEAGRRCVVLDADPQGSAYTWAAASTQQGGRSVLDVRPANQGSLIADAGRLAAEGFDHVLIDSPPGVSGVTATIVKAADLILIPVQPSPSDIWAVGDLISVITARQQVAQGRPKALFAVNRAVKGTVLARTIDQGLEEFGLPILKSRLYQRIAYPEAWMQGVTVLELGGIL